MTSETGEITESARRLVDNLATLQHALAGRPDGERRQAIEGALREALSGLDPRRAEQLLARCRDLVLDRARDRDERTRPAETDAARLKVEVESLRAERDRLRSDNTRLEALAKVKDAGGSGLDQLLVELRTLGDESAPQQIAPGLAGSEARILATSHALVWFAFNLGRQLKFFEANVLSEGSVIIKEYEKRFRRLYLESLDGKDGAIEKLRQLLGEMALFVGRVTAHGATPCPSGRRRCSPSSTPSR